MSGGIVLEDLTKRYGAARGVEDLSLTVEPGEVVGLLGPNGAGKTTTLRVLLGFLKPTAGSARVIGLDAWEQSTGIHERVGYLPGDVGLYNGLTARQILNYAAALRGKAPRMEELAERFGLEWEKRAEDLSKGNRQKVGLVLAFMHDPDVAILDEPTSGLDPLLQNAFNELVDEERARGKAILLSSHLFSEIERLCDRTAILREGRLVALDRTSELRARAGTRVRVRFAGHVDANRFRIPGVEVRAETERELDLVVHGELDAIVKRLAEHRVEALSVDAVSLEETFLSRYRGESG